MHVFLVISYFPVIVIKNNRELYVNLTTLSYFFAMTWLKIIPAKFRKMKKMRLDLCRQNFSSTINISTIISEKPKKMIKIADFVQISRPTDFSQTRGLWQ